MRNSVTLCGVIRHFRWLRPAAGAALACLMATGCATVPPTESCAPWMMTKSKPIPDVKSGDDIIEKYAELRSEAGKDKSKVRGLQACTRAMTGH